MNAKYDFVLWSNHDGNQAKRTASFNSIKQCKRSIIPEKGIHQSKNA